MSKTLKHVGKTLLENGYKFIPIIPFDADHPHAGKAPAFKNWQSTVVDRDTLSSWEKRYAGYGVGIQTHDTPAVDIDSTDADAARHMSNFVQDLVGFSPIRVGRAPKTLLLYRTDTPFAKVKSAVWEDDLEQRHAVEILGSGQQFVAYGTHPVTKKPYQWIGVDNPLNCAAPLDLEEITEAHARAITAEFDRYARAQGWTKVADASDGGSVLGLVASGEVEEDDWVDADDLKDRWGGTIEELAELMADYPTADDYDDWYPVLAALKDGERFPDEFKEIAREWSAKSENYTDEGFEEKWEGGNFNRSGANVLTLSMVSRKVDTVRMEVEIEQDILPLFLGARTLQEWDRAASRLREVPVWGSVRDLAVLVACDEYRRITSKKIPIETKRRALSVDYTKFDAPAWLEPWVYSPSGNVFINKISRLALSPHGFNNAHAPDTLHLGTTPEMFATALRPVPNVRGGMYCPDMHGGMEGSEWEPVRGVEGEEFFQFKGETYLNTFSPDSIPRTAEKMTKKGRAAVDKVINFFKTQFTDPKEYQYAMDWMAWVINNPTKRISYALTILGGEGSGKTIIGKFMSKMLGAANVGVVSNNVIHRPFTGWQEGDILKIIEEISITGQRYNVMNTLKEPIGNQILNVEPKGDKPKDIINTASYMAFTNHVGALPVNDSNRRFLIVRSRFQIKHDVEEFTKTNKTFFKDFEEAFTNYTSEIRLWFKDWAYSDGFNHTGHAPSDTASFSEMKEVSADDFTQFIRDAMEDLNQIGITPELIHGGLMGEIVPKELMPSKRFVSERMAELGFVPLIDENGKRIRVCSRGSQGTIYVKKLAEWRGPKKVPLVSQVKRHLNAHAKQVDMVAASGWADSADDDE